MKKEIKINKNNNKLFIKEKENKENIIEENKVITKNCGSFNILKETTSGIGGYGLNLI